EPQTGLGTTYSRPYRLIYISLFQGCNWPLLMSRYILVIWLAFSVLMGFALGGSFVSAFLSPSVPANESCAEAKDPNSQTPEERHAAAQTELNLYTKWLMAFTGLLAFATIALGITTFGLYTAGLDQLKLTRSEFLSPIAQ